MDATRPPRAAGHAPEEPVRKRQPAHRAHASAPGVASIAPGRLVSGPPAAPDAILALQATIGNHTVARTLAKTIAQEEELALQRTAVEVAVADSASIGGPAITPGHRPGIARPPVHDLLAKAVLALDSSAAPSIGLNAGDYGLTFPERVGVEIGARLDAGGTTWSPVVKKLTGHYSMQVRLLPGQKEIGGPGGNTNKTNFCDQCANLKRLGMVAGNTWYVIAAVVAHENVHATRFLPALVDVETAITAAIEAVTVPHADPMTEPEAVKALEADGAYRSAVARAYQVWLGKCAARVAKDHDFGGATDKAERTVTEPLRTTICAHAKKEKWGACASCPP